MQQPPKDLRPNQIPAWKVLAGGGSYKKAAERSSVSTGTVSNWVRQWRKIHGDDLFRTERQVVAAAQTDTARVAAEKTWHELRTTEARNLGVTASQIRARLMEILPQVATSRIDRGTTGRDSPIMIQGPQAREIKALADAVSTLLATAELLDNRPTAHTRRSVPQDQWTAPALGSGQPTGRDEKTAQVLDLVQRLKDRQTG